ncbi:hypothetical protein J6590_016726 [Homalodisca vitripennis]|nr:hypothetical protein J6590_016726 [Homalodisca vitripennis]
MKNRPYPPGLHYTTVHRSTDESCSLGCAKHKGQSVTEHVGMVTSMSVAWRPQSLAVCLLSHDST